jgi:hypothetical protein
MMRFLLELLRIIFIFALLGSLLGLLLENVYLIFGFNIEKYGWLATMGIYVLLFVLYRNKLQFTGWYTGKGREKLPKKVSQILIGCSVLLLILPPTLSLLLS